MRITVNDQNFRKVKRKIDYTNKNIIPELVDSPASMKIISEEVVTIGARAYTQYTIDVALPKLVIGDFVVWAHAHGDSPEPGDFFTYKTEDCPDYIDEFLAKIIISDCDHCNTNRKRVNTYVVEDTQGKHLIQVGSNCLAEYVGIKDKDIRAIDNFHKIKLFQNVDNDFNNPEGYARDIVLACALQTAIQSKGYQYQETIQETKNMLKQESFPNLEKEVEELKNHIKSVESYSDYMNKVKKIIQSEIVSERDLNLIISSVSLSPIFAKGYADEYMGKVKENISDVKVKIETVKFYEDYTRFVAVDEKKHKLVWFKPYELNAFNVVLGSEFQKGDNAIIKNAQIKKFNLFNGVKQTQLKNVELEK